MTHDCEQTNKKLYRYIRTFFWILSRWWRLDPFYSKHVHSQLYVHIYGNNALVGVAENRRIFFSFVASNTRFGYENVKMNGLEWIAQTSYTLLFLFDHIWMLLLFIYLLIFWATSHSPHNEWWITTNVLLQNNNCRISIWSNAYASALQSLNYVSSCIITVAIQEFYPLDFAILC